MDMKNKGYSLYSLMLEMDNNNAAAMVEFMLSYLEGASDIVFECCHCPFKKQCKQAIEDNNLTCVEFILKNLKTKGGK